MPEKLVELGKDANLDNNKNKNSTVANGWVC